MLPIDIMIITQTFTMARWQNCCQKVRGNQTNQRPKQQQEKQTNKQKTTPKQQQKTKNTTKRVEGGRGIKQITNRMVQ